MYGWVKRPISPQFAVSLTAMFNLLRESKQSQPKEATWEKSTNMSDPQKLFERMSILRSGFKKT